MVFVALTGNYVNLNVDEQDRVHRIHLLLSLQTGGTISYAGSAWHGWWNFDIAKGQVRGIFETRRKHEAASVVHAFSVQALPDGRFGQGVDDNGSTVWLSNIRWVHWLPQQQLWGVPRSLEDRPLFDLAVDDDWEIVN